MSLDPDTKINGIVVPCGQCLACRINKRRIWTTRLMLESFFHDKASFVTLTYADEELPYDLEGNATLCKRDVQLFIKRLRKQFGSGIRYYAVGEYGEKSHRPHYHLIVFGLSPFDLDTDWLLFKGQSGRFLREHRDTRLSRLWLHGLVHVGECTRDSIQYVAGYVLKKFVKRGDSQQREFSLMSRRPGIGLQAVEHLVIALRDVDAPPRQIRINGKLWPVGRYLFGKLADAIGYEGAADDFINSLRQKHQEYVKSGGDPLSSSFLDWLISTDDQRFLQLEQRSQRFTVRDF